MSTLKNDWYTKLVLTIIAVALVVLCFKDTNVASVALAQSDPATRPAEAPPLRVIVVNDQQRPIPIYSFSNVPVSIQNKARDPVPVSLQEITRPRDIGPHGELWAPIATEPARR